MQLAASALLLASWAVSICSAGQIPVVDGVIGGVGANAKHTNVTALPHASKDLASTPGKLRIVENSGVCGK